MIKENFVPKYQKIIDDLRENVRSGVLAPGERLPVREELMQQYGVTRATVNRAMAELLREGLLVATPRAGTYVAERNTGDEVAVVVHSTLVMLHKMDWTIACNYYAMFGRLFQLLPENERKILNMEEVSRNPDGTFTLRLGSTQAVIRPGSGVFSSVPVRWECSSSETGARVEAVFDAGPSRSELFDERTELTLACGVEVLPAGGASEAGAFTESVGPESVTAAWGSLALEFPRFAQKEW